MANQFVPDQGDEFKKKMTLITDVASDKHLGKSRKCPKCKCDPCECATS